VSSGQRLRDELLAQDPPHAVILSAAPNYKTDIPARFGETVAALREDGVQQVIVAGPVPIWPYPVPQAIMREYLAGGKKAIPTTIELPGEIVAEMSDLDGRLKAASHKSGAVYESSFRKLCSEGTCRAMIEGEPAVWDILHLTLPASTLVAKDIYLDLLGR
jgi:SGNH domain (fused to AT3 domains)